MARSVSSVHPRRDPGADNREHSCTMARQASCGYRVYRYTLLSRNCFLLCVCFDRSGVLRAPLGGHRLSPECSRPTSESSNPVNRLERNTIRVCQPHAAWLTAIPAVGSALDCLDKCALFQVEGCSLASNYLHRRDQQSTAAVVTRKFVCTWRVLSCTWGRSGQFLSRQFTGLSSDL